MSDWNYADIKEQGRKAEIAEDEYGKQHARNRRVVDASTRVFKANERFNALRMMNVPSDRDAALKQSIDYNLARAELIQAESELSRAVEPI